MNEKKQEKLEELQNELERDWKILGVTAIEDKLQDDVESTI